MNRYRARASLNHLIWWLCDSPFYLLTNTTFLTIFVITFCNCFSDWGLKAATMSIFTVHTSFHMMFLPILRIFKYLSTSTSEGIVCHSFFYIMFYSFMLTCYRFIAYRFASVFHSNFTAQRLTAFHFYCDDSRAFLFYFCTHPFNYSLTHRYRISEKRYRTGGKDFHKRKKWYSDCPSACPANG